MGTEGGASRGTQNAKQQGRRYALTPLRRIGIIPLPDPNNASHPPVSALAFKYPACWSCRATRALVASSVHAQ